VALLTVAVRLPGTVNDPLWFDETASAKVITSGSPLDVAREVWETESTPVGWYLLAWSTYEAGRVAALPSDRLDGLASEKGPRILSVVFSAILTVLVVVYASRRMPLWAAGLAGLFVALGYQLVEHGQELRAYSLLGLVAMLFVLSLEAAVAQPIRRRLVVLALVVALGAVTHYFFLLAVATGAAWVWTRAPRASAGRVSLSIAAGLLPFVAMLPVFIHQSTAQADARRWIGELSLDTVAKVYGHLFAPGAAWTHTGEYGPLLVLPLVLAGAIVLGRRPDGELGALMATVPVAAAATLWAAGQNIFVTRNLILVAPFAAVAAAAGVAALPNRPLAIGAAGALAAAMVAGSLVERGLGRMPNDDMAKALVDMGWTPESPIVFYGVGDQQATLAWYLPDRPALGAGTPTGRPCPRVYVVAETGAGRAFIRSYRRYITKHEVFPWYGPLARGSRRRGNVHVAEMAWTDGILPAAPTRTVRALHATTHAPPPCLADPEE
jgi:hypothetical protein